MSDAQGRLIIDSRPYCIERGPEMYYPLPCHVVIEPTPSPLLSIKLPENFWDNVIFLEGENTILLKKPSQLDKLEEDTL